MYAVAQVVVLQMDIGVMKGRKLKSLNTSQHMVFRQMKMFTAINVVKQLQDIFMYLSKNIAVR